MENSHGFLPKLCDLEILNKVIIYCEKIIKSSPEINYFKNVHLNYPYILKILPNKLNGILSDLLKTNEFFLETVELHIQKPDCEPIPPHQDNFYHCTEYNKSLKILIPLNFLNSKNGGLFFCDCPIEFPVMPHVASKTINFSSFIEKKELSKINLVSTSYEYQLGDASYHFINNLHYSNGNKTSFKTMFLVFRYLLNDATQDSEALVRYENCFKKHKEYLEENN